MHKGRQYPYLGHFWATEFLLWPRYAPLSFLLTRESVDFDAWNVVPFGTDMFLPWQSASPSFASVEWGFIDPGGFYTLTYDLFQSTILGVKHAVWECTCRLFNGHYGQIQEAIPIVDNLSPGHPPFSGWTVTHADAPEFLGGLPAIHARPAGWSFLPRANLDGPAKWWH